MGSATNISYFQHQLLPSGDKRVVGASLQFPRISRSDRGTYICTADNNVGPPVMAALDLNVICKLILMMMSNFIEKIYDKP